MEVEVVRKIRSRRVEMAGSVVGSDLRVLQD